ncbi:hypothetical protein HYH03_006506 [Edaphochlamys debaryana]|uniref:F-box domain-containing protein n=1 Tax=Edaphochlamys debaryana TaxID=47281 RepID=A0A835Y4Y7_9CHLO|nr:hypothetical protein HYH03_006506 [Edaphochlamys debaryana]|eukprot:KAG2495232.1 hypothetical protein HYH03_006506 [Edaphochlamys debaryana]
MPPRAKPKPIKASARRLPELPGEIWSLIIQRVDRCSELRGVRLASKQLCTIVDSQTTQLRIRLTPDSSRFWRARGLLKWPSCTSVTLVWDALEVRHADVGKYLSQPFARITLESRQHVSALTVEAKFYGRVYEEGAWSDYAERWEAASGDEPPSPQPVETFDEDTMHLPAKPLAALLRLLPGLHTVRLPPGTPFQHPHLDTYMVMSALQTLTHLRDLTLPSFDLAPDLTKLSGLQHLTHLVLQPLKEHDVEDYSSLEGMEPDVLQVEGVDGICSLQRLKHLELYSAAVDQIFDTDVREFLDELPALERLVVGGLATEMLDELDDDVEADEEFDRSNLDENYQLALDLSGGHITSIDLSYRGPHRHRSTTDVVSLGLVSYLARTLLLPHVRSAPAPRVKALSLRCEVTLGLTDAQGAWLAPLRELVERCEAVAVQGLDVTPREAMRRVTAAEVETLLRLFGKPQRLRLGNMTEMDRVRLRRRREPPSLECEPGTGCPARLPARLHGVQSQLAKAVQAVWDDRAGGSELQRLRGMMQAAGLGGGPGADRAWEYRRVTCRWQCMNIRDEDSDDDSDLD